MTKKKDIAGLFKLVLIASVFFAPLILATWLYVSGTGFRPEGRTNHGEILQPLINIRDVLPDSAIHKFNNGHWLLIYANDGDCDAACEYALYTLRQSRLMLGKEMDRLVRVFLHGDTAPDTVFLANEHAGLITLRDNDFSDLLENKKPAELSDGGYYLVDPLGNLVMYFRPDIDPGDMVEDIKHLLELSRIG
jgi:cytochrome oxidase Cu insertion factor (SCO1/SenC/PrrC family)